MLTIHATPGLAVAVEGDRVVALGPAGQLEQAYPQARVRQWQGVIGPGLLHRGPLPPAPSARERVHALLRLGATAAQPDQLADPVLRAAAHRNGLAVSDRSPVLEVGARADLAVFAADGSCVATVLAGRLVHRRA
ncbi:hypothetical protein [Streptacidiphilus sp. PB12-B1b]|uniref:imidazolonepropionase-like domain-containing protein n=1 Tax=Streptacidiphilus sp. PB12-B1b TaxID=2705012 RepID=UPI0015F87E03|nr:hypothetical protein [Streptacidiphilus sp. PB12-B1b]